MNFTMTLSRVASAQVTVNYATSDGTATAGADGASSPPYARRTLGEDEHRTWRTGARWQLAPEVALGLETSSGAGGEGNFDRVLMLRAQARF